MRPASNEALVRAFMLGPGGLLRRYRPSVHLTGDLRKAEADDLARDLLEVLPDDLPEDELVMFLEATRRALRRTWGGPWWPTSTMIREAAEAAKQGRKGPEPEQAILGWLADWWRRHGRCAPGLGTPERTARLIQMGVLTARQARAGAFPLTDRDEAAARQQPPCAAEIETERRFRDRIGRRVAGGSDVAPR